MVDYPESCTICLIRQNQACPICLIPKTEFSSLDVKYPLRTVAEMQNIFMEVSTSKDTKLNVEKTLQQYGLRNIMVSIMIIFGINGKVMFMN